MRTGHEPKKMRDERLYIELGYSAFEDYTENAVGLKRSQAYDYIRALESLGVDVFKSASKFGISKVKVLCAFSSVEAKNFISENNIDEITVKELKAKVEELTKHGEQLTLELEQLEDAKDDAIETLRAENEMLKTEISDHKNKPTEVAVREPTSEELSKIIKKEVEKIKHEYDGKLKEVRTLEKEKYTAEATQAFDELKREKERSANLEKQIKMGASPELTRFLFYFEALQENVKKLGETLDNIDCKKNILKFIMIS